MKDKEVKEYIRMIEYLFECNEIEREDLSKDDMERANKIERYHTDKANIRKAKIEKIIKEIELKVVIECCEEFATVTKRINTWDEVHNTANKIIEELVEIKKKELVKGDKN